MVKTYVIEQQPLPKQGLVDGGHVILECSGCGSKLVDIWVIKPDAVRPDGQPFVWQGVAHCPYCGDKSFLKSWRGKFARHGYAVNKPGDEDFTKFTDIDREDMVGDVIHYYLKKVRDQ